MEPLGYVSPPHVARRLQFKHHSCSSTRSPGPVQHVGLEHHGRTWVTVRGRAPPKILVHSRTVKQGRNAGKWYRPQDLSFTDKALGRFSGIDATKHESATSKYRIHGQRVIRFLMAAQHHPCIQYQQQHDVIIMHANVLTGVYILEWTLICSCCLFRYSSTSVQAFGIPLRTWCTRLQSCATHACNESQSTPRMTAHSIAFVLK